MGLSRADAAYKEAERAFANQLAAWQEIRTRTSTLLAATALVTAFLGSEALDRDPSVDLLTWIALASFFLTLATCLYVLVPRTGAWHDHVQISELLDPQGVDHVGANYSRDPEALQEQLAAELEHAWDQNNRNVLAPMYDCFSAATIFLVAEVVCWMSKLAG